MTNINHYTLGIDATNLRSGGGVTHLVEMLGALQLSIDSNFNRVIVWGSKSTLNAIKDRPWLTKYNPIALNQGLLRRVIWQRFSLSKAARRNNCTILLVPGGSYAGSFHPVVTMSQNLLPFEMAELRRYGWTLFSFKLLCLRMIQTKSFRKSDGVIFLTEYARDTILNTIGKLHGKVCVVPHGLNPRFNMQPKIQHPIDWYSNSRPYRMLYVSIIDQYKHQWRVVEAIAKLRKLGFPIELDLVGPAYTPALKRLNKTIASLDMDGGWVHYHGAIPFDELHLYYAQADLGIFASSCENMPNILLETMGAGLPIACSNRGPMTEVMGGSGNFFDPEKSHDIARALRELIDSPQTRVELAQTNHGQAKKYSWVRCADDIFRFLTEVVEQRKKGNGDI